MSNFFIDKRNHANWLDKQYEFEKLQIQEEELTKNLAIVSKKLQECKDQLTPQLNDTPDEDKNAFTLGMEARINMLKLEESLAYEKNPKKITPIDSYAIKCFHNLIRETYNEVCNMNVKNKDEINRLVSFLNKFPNALFYQVNDDGFKSETIIALSHWQIMKYFNHRIIKSINGINTNKKTIENVEECLIYNNKYGVNIFTGADVSYEE